LAANVNWISLWSCILAIYISPTFLINVTTTQYRTFQGHSAFVMKYYNDKSILLAISNIISTLQLAEPLDSMDDVQRTVELSLCTS